MTMSVQSEIQKITDIIVKNYQPEKIILFGSYAWGTPTDDSDIDLMVIKETDNTRKSAREIDSSIFPRLFPIDIIVYRPSQFNRRIKDRDFFIENIVNRGEVLYAKK